MELHELSKHELKQKLSALMGWDPCVADGVLEALDATEDPGEAQEIAMSFMGDNPDAIVLVEKYCTSKKKTSHNVVSSPQQVHFLADEQPSQSTYVSFAGIFLKREESIDKSQASVSNTNKNDEKENKKLATKEQKGKRNNKADEKEKRKLPSEMMQRKVVNCLSCGKIYDSRKLSEAIYQFLDSGGICLFCGAQVNLSFSSNENQNQNSETVQRAIEFKDRLVDYDRNSAQRTTVLDDQSDYFEIDTNVWLDEKEKQELKQRRNIEEEFAKAQRNKVHYTIDLVGRKVFVTENAVPTEEAKRVAEAATRAAECTLAEQPQGGGTAARDASQTASELLRRTNGESRYKFRVQKNPDIKLASPIFLPSNQAVEESKKAKESGPSWIQGYSGRLQHDDVFAAFDEEIEQEIISADLTEYSDLFENWGNDVFDLCPDTKQQNSFTKLDSARMDGTSISANTRLSTMIVPDPDSSICIANGPELPHLYAGDKMPDGLVLLKNWLSFEDQVKIVEMVRELGVGEGGFYTPGYGTDAKLKLKMMCLGMNWNPTNRIYETTRSNFDGAPAPPIPEYFTKLVQRCMRDANRLSRRPLASIDPNICLCNFYTRDSLLGLHQDREEGTESLRRQIPVISFSIGATGEFVFNTTRSMDAAKSILLESGDALLFGGPSRMIFHGIRKIFPESMPQELADYTKMRTGRLNLTIRQYIPERKPAKG